MASSSSSRPLRAIASSCGSPTPPGLALELEEPRALALGAGSPRTLALELDCDRWGAYALGPLRVRRYDQLRLVADEHTVDLDAMLRVYPTREALRALVRPIGTQAAVGDQVARTKGEGIELAELRPFSEGDDLRRVNWHASARTGELVVNELHPERNTAVVLLLDTFADLGTARNPLDECVRAAAALAERYLARRDRVGLLPLGGTMRWLRPASGAVQRQRIVETLLEARPLPPSGEGARLVVPTRFVPPQALVLALTPLLDDAVVARAARAARPRLRPRRRRAAAALLRLARRRGRPAARHARARPPAQPAAGTRDRGRRVGRGAVAGGDGPRDGGVPTKSARRPRVATAIAALVAAVACAAYPVVTGSLVNGLVPLACLIGIGAHARRAARALGGRARARPRRDRPRLRALARAGRRRARPRRAARRRRPARRRRARLLVARAPRRPRGTPAPPPRRVLVLLVAAFAVSLVVLSVGGLQADAGIALFAVGAAAALGLFALLARSKIGGRSTADQSGVRPVAPTGPADSG